MKICTINAVYGIRSTGQIVADVHNSLTTLGHESTVFAAEIPDQFTQTKGVLKIGNIVNHKLHGLLSRITGLQGYFSHMATKRLTRQLDRIKPDIVHLHNLHSNYIHVDSLLRFLAIRKIPVVITLHDFWFMTGKCTHFINVNCYKWRDSCGNCPKLKADNKSWIFDRTTKMLKDKERLFKAIPNLTVISVSDWVKSFAIESILGCTSKHERIYNWVDNRFISKPAFNNNEIGEYLGITNNLPSLLLVATSWETSKGLNDLLWLIEHFDYEKFNLIIVGGVRNDSLKKGRHYWIDEIHDIDLLSSIFHFSEYFLNLSKTETFGRVTVEAGLSGCKIIGFPTTGNKEIIEKFNGFPISSVKQVSGILKSTKESNIIQEHNLLNNPEIKDFYMEYGLEKNISLYSDIVSNRDR
ncbi:MAG: group 1 glycosyl transferase [Idiomarinaceae bacterium]|nr:group 1 glycosyl transferase [Idiomarinaceae bacterium]